MPTATGSASHAASDHDNVSVFAIAIATALIGFLRDLFTHHPDSRRNRDRLARLARLLDSAVQIPGTNIRIGLDPLLGIVPGGGDLAGTLLSLYIVVEAKRMGLPNAALVRMIGNIAFDVTIGLVPILGDIGDVFFRANRRNIAVLDEYLDAPFKSRRSRRS